jgi:hypothetical protein
MKLFIPSIQGITPRFASLALVACAAIGLTVQPASAKMPNIKLSSSATLSFELAPPVVDPPPVEPSTATGTATISIEEERKTAPAYGFEVAVAGLAAGTYSVEALVENSAEPVLITDALVVTAVAPATTGTGEFAAALPAGINPRGVLTLNVFTVDAISTVKTIVLTGAAVLETTELNYFANVRITAPAAPSGTEETDPTTDPVTGKGKKGKAGKGGKKVHGHVLLKSTIEAGVETKRQVLFVGHGGPSAVELDIVVDGVVVEGQTVTSTKNGKVMFKTLPADIALESIELLEIVDPATGNAVMQADFTPVP